MGARIVFSFTALIQRGNGEIAYHVHTFRSGGTFNSLSEIKKYIERCEGERLSLEGAAWIRAYLPPEKKINKPGVNEGGVEFREVQIKVINTREPLVGCGRLPDELRKKRCIYSVDDKDDNLCVWRCLAILMNIIAGKQNPEKYIEKQALNLAKTFYKNKKLKKEDVRSIKLVDFEKISKVFSINIRAYEQKNITNFKVWKLVFGKNNFKDNLPTLNLGLYNNHGFFIKNLNLLAESWVCQGCKQKFTRHEVLKRHFTNETCTGGKTKILCTGEKIKHIRNESDNVFYGGKIQFSYKACRWIENQSKIIGKHIHHGLCGHGGERCYRDERGKEILFDGYEPETNTVFEFYGCKWHGCPCSTTDKVKYNETIEREKRIKSLGYKVVSVWECENPELPNIWFKKKFFPYPYNIIFDFESILQKEDKHITDDLSFTNIHIPVSVAIIDNLTNKRVFLYNQNPDELIKEFVEKLGEIRKIIVEKVKEEYPMPEQDSLQKHVLEKYEEWCNQVPVFGFNSGKYDINLIKRHFIKHMTDKTKDIFIAKKQNRYMFLSTPYFKFLNIMSYLAPGISFDGWCKANNCEAKKLVLPYEFLDSYDKLSHIGPVKHEDFYSSLKKKNISKEEYEEYLIEFKKRGCVTMLDWLKEYNLNDVIPFLEALRKNKAFILSRRN